MKIEKSENGINKVQINYVKDSIGKSSVMVNIREDDPKEAIKLYKEMRLLLTNATLEIEQEVVDIKNKYEMENKSPF